ncbi:MAG: acyl-CoA dehydrogenase family protein [Deltaproteobacteria bacterium]|nr:acyl-CoA dehydrogenase family protein [Deltaproteobacteria bacterium]MBW2363083.1 acyl-CoA dehydrogenase family protein [Deltaproteobacteria bacterium]
MSSSHGSFDALEKARAAAPTVEAGARIAEQERALPRESVDALASAGAFWCLAPKAVGGLELDPLSAIELFEEFSRQDGSAGWCAGIGAVTTGIVAAGLPDAGAERLFGGERLAICAGGFTPRAQALRTPEGYRISGRFPFGSGCRHADWMVLTATVSEDGDDGSGQQGVPEIRSFCVPQSSVTLHDNWDAAGLQGTCSNDYEVQDLVVDEAFSFRIFDGWKPQRGGNLFRASCVVVAYMAHLGFALGVGRRALDDLSERAFETQRFGTGVLLKDEGTFLREHAHELAKLRAARLLAFDAYGALWEAVKRGDDPSLRERARVAAAVVHTYRTAASAADFAFRSLGASVLYRSDRIQRCFRDIRAGMQHIVASEAMMERVGQVELGVAPEDMIL